MKHVLQSIISQWKYFPYKVLLKSFCFYLTCLIPYLAIIITLSIFGLLFGVFPRFLDFTFDYFYGGKFLYVFDAWRVHIVYYIICLISSVKNDL